MPDLAEMDLYCAEARDIVSHAEEIVHRLEREGACEGHRMMANQGLVALRRLDHVIERYRKRLAFEARPNAVGPPPTRKRHWLIALRLRGEHASPRIGAQL